MSHTFRTRAAGVLALAVCTSLGLAACSSGDGASGDDASGDAASDCTPAHEGIETVSDGKLTVGVIDLVPFSSYNSGDPEGIDLNIVNAIAEKECLEPVYQQATYGDAIQSIQNGAIDLATGSIDVTETRLEVVDFSASIYLDGMGIASKSGAETISDLESLDAVGTVDGYLWNEDVAAILGDKLKTYPSSVELKADFDAGRIDAALDAYATQTIQFADDDSVTVFLAQDNPDERVTTSVQPPEAAFPYTKGNTTLGAALDDNILAMREDGTITGWVTDAGLTESLAEVADEQFIVPAS